MWENLTPLVAATLNKVNYQKLSSGFLITDLKNAQVSSGIVRLAPKILKSGVEQMARSATYMFALHQKQIAGASCAITAEPQNEKVALTSFVNEISPKVASGNFLPDVGKGLTEDNLAPLRAGDPRNEIRLTDIDGACLLYEYCTGISSVAAIDELFPLEGKAVVIEGFNNKFNNAAYGALAALENVGAKLVGVSIGKNSVINESGLDISALKEIVSDKTLQEEALSKEVSKEEVSKEKVSKEEMQKEKVSKGAASEEKVAKRAFLKELKEISLKRFGEKRAGKKDEEASPDQLEKMGQPKKAGQLEKMGQLGKTDGNIFSALSNELSVDALFLGSKIGVVDHTINLPISALGSLHPIPFTTKAMMELSRNGTIVAPDFLCLGGQVIADWHESNNVEEIISAADVETRAITKEMQKGASKKTGSGKNGSKNGNSKNSDVAQLFLAGCEMAEEFIMSWQDELPFGRPLA